MYKSQCLYVYVMYVTMQVRVERKVNRYVLGSLVLGTFLSIMLSSDIQNVKYVIQGGRRQCDAVQQLENIRHLCITSPKTAQTVHPLVTFHQVISLQWDLQCVKNHLFCSRYQIGAQYLTDRQTDNISHQLSSGARRLVNTPP